MKSRAPCGVVHTSYIPLNKPHNGRLAGLFPEVTHEEFLRREVEYTVGSDREEIQLLSLISPWEKFVAYR